MKHLSFGKKMNFKEAKAMGVFGGMIGAAIGGYLSVLKGNYIYTGLGGGIGFIIGFTSGLLLAGKKSLNFIIGLDKKLSKIDVILSFLLSIAGMVVFFKSGELVGLFGMIFFALCGLFIWWKNKLPS